MPLPIPAFSTFIAIRASCKDQYLGIMEAVGQILLKMANSKGEILVINWIIFKSL
jgi:hypothetical protein